jgi:hypothetical protein
MFFQGTQSLALARASSGKTTGSSGNTGGDTVSVGSMAGKAQSAGASSQYDTAMAKATAALGADAVKKAQTTIQEATDKFASLSSSAQSMMADMAKIVSASRAEYAAREREAYAVASQTATLNKQAVLTQQGISALAQANQAPKSVLSLFV